MSVVSNAVEKFIEASIQHGVGTETGNSKLANKSYKVIKKNYDIIKENDLVNVLINLLEHENISVKLWAASYMLNIETEKAIAALKEVIGSKSPLISFSAEMTLSEWEKGNLKF
jgi:HEAT repeat protein